jgi:hypothetical protein
MAKLYQCDRGEPSQEAEKAKNETGVLPSEKRLRIRSSPSIRPLRGSTARSGKPTWVRVALLPGDRCAAALRASATAHGTLG